MEGILKIFNNIRFLNKNVFIKLQNKIDKKGQVSVPATFRSHLNSMGYNDTISYPLLTTLL